LLLKLSHHAFDDFLIFLLELLLRVSISYLSVKQFKQNFIKLDADHLVIHYMVEVRRGQDNLFEPAIKSFVFLP